MSLENDATPYKDSNPPSRLPINAELIQQFDAKLSMMNNALDAVKGKCTVLAQRAISADLESSSASDRIGSL
eukprot:gene15509-21598_t